VLALRHHRVIGRHEAVEGGQFERNLEEELQQPLCADFLAAWELPSKSLTRVAPKTVLSSRRHGLVDHDWTMIFDRIVNTILNGRMFITEATKAFKAVTGNAWKTSPPCSRVRTTVSKERPASTTASAMRRGASFL
jgi:hypothetical protein